VNKLDVVGAAPMSSSDLPGNIENPDGTFNPTPAWCIGDSRPPPSNLVSEANAQFNAALWLWLTSTSPQSLTYRNHEPWSQLLRSKVVYNRMRAEIRKRAKAACASGAASSFVGWTGQWDDDGRDNVPGLQVFLDLVNYVVGKSLKSLGRNNGWFTITSVDCDKCSVSYDMVVTDAFRWGSATAVPVKEWDRSWWPDHPVTEETGTTWGRGIGGSMWFPPTSVSDEWHTTLNIRWEWTENLCFFGTQ
jgi:hypothetical protein